MTKHMRVKDVHGKATCEHEGAKDRSAVTAALLMDRLFTSFHIYITMLWTGYSQRRVMMYRNTI